MNSIKTKTQVASYLEPVHVLVVTRVNSYIYLYLLTLVITYLGYPQSYTRALIEWNKTMKNWI